VLLPADMFHKIKSPIEMVLLFHYLHIVRNQAGGETMPFEHLRHDREMIRQRPPAHSRERTTPGEHLNPINHRLERAQLKIRKTRAFPRQLVQIRRLHRMPSDKSEVVVTKRIRTDDDYVHACSARPCSQRTRFNRRVSSNLELLSRKLSRESGG